MNREVEALELFKDKLLSSYVYLDCDEDLEKYYLVIDLGYANHKIDLTEEQYNTLKVLED